MMSFANVFSDEPWDEPQPEAAAPPSVEAAEAAVPVAAWSPRYAPVDPAAADAAARLGDHWAIDGAATSRAANDLFRAILKFIQLNAEIADDELLAIRCIFSHVEFHQVVKILIMEQHRLQPYILADKVSELLGGDLA